jgi:hypothetical protein
VGGVGPRGTSEQLCQRLRRSQFLLLVILSALRNAR